ncbi:hypothetical protein ACFWYA_21490 [Streptomyces sp. NPDC059011]
MRARIASRWVEALTEEPLDDHRSDLADTFATPGRPVRLRPRA